MTTWGCPTCWATSHRPRQCSRVPAGCHYLLESVTLTLASFSALSLHPFALTGNCNYTTFYRILSDCLIFYKLNVTLLFPGLYPLAEACVNLSGTAVHPSWTAMAILGQKFYVVTSILQTISCASPQSPTPLFNQGDEEVTTNAQHCIVCVFLHLLHLSNHKLWFFLVPQASCQDCQLEESASTKETLETFCRSDFGKYKY